VVQMVLGVLKGHMIIEALNHTFLSLIPKIEHPHLVTQFRPIELCNVTYKLITKVIVEHLNEILCHVTSPIQTSFIPRRQISDNVVIIQEMPHMMRQKKGSKGYMAIKIDFENAYDRVHWSFAKDMLIRLQFPPMLV